MNLLSVLAAIAAGAALSIQVGVNNSLRSIIGSPILAAFVSFSVGSLCLLAYALLTRAPWPSLQTVSKVPVWAWLGGALGAYYIATSIFVAPKLGAASLISILVTAQLCTSLILDHFGAVGFAQHSINAWRIFGALLLVGGVVLIVRN
ncbi:DMT family transporter [Noviherbaspirillum massiliense]|uniref:DMT family transporter n=1 Tax=Noviherbaspirillum massiliense TaxID=1465823 RepID=UPI0002D3D630|nr:DMT family transporter [Noviherbaspirillum massiliense]